MHDRQLCPIKFISTGWFASTSFKEIQNKNEKKKLYMWRSAPEAAFIYAFFFLSFMDAPFIKVWRVEIFIRCCIFIFYIGIK